MASRIAEAARRAAEALEERAFFGGRERPRATSAVETAIRGAGAGWGMTRSPIVTPRRVQIAFHIGCPDARGPSWTPLVVQDPREAVRRCTACGFTWTELALVEAPRLEEVGIGTASVPEIEFLAAIGQAERDSQALRPAAQPPAENETLAEGNPHGLPVYRPR